MYALLVLALAYDSVRFSSSVPTSVRKCKDHIDIEISAQTVLTLSDKLVLEPIYDSCRLSSGLAFVSTSTRSREDISRP